MRYDLTPKRNSVHLPRTVRLLLLVCGLGLLVFSLPRQASACGLIIGPTDRFDPNLPTIETPIVDCDNPFGVLPTGSPFVLRIAGEDVEPNSTRLIPMVGTAEYQVYSPPQVFDSRHAFYRHEGDNLRFVPSTPTKPTESDYELLAADFFAPNEPAQLYIDFLLGVWSVSSDPAWDWNRLNDFEVYTNANFDDSPPALLPGTYTLLSEEMVGMINAVPTWDKRLLALVIKTAHAQYFPENRLYAMTFTLGVETPKQEGASNILFVPGIMGTRLYEHSAECGGEVRERERWFSRDGCDQRRLQTTFTGVSVNQIYTKPGIVSIIDEAGAFGINLNIYKSFLANLRNWRQDGQIKDFAVLPYDWRLGLDTLMTMYLDEDTGKIKVENGRSLETGYIYRLISELASTSDSGRVTVVTHSNGGLLMKYFLSRLTARQDPLLDKIDNLILVAVPQVGTPEAVLGMLHGTELSFVMKQEVTRLLMNTLPAAHHLLPGEDYFWSDRGGVLTPVIEFEAGSASDAWREQFGASISSWSSLRNFLSKDSGRTAPSEDDLLTPAVVDPFLLNYARTTHTIINNWQPPSSLKIYQIAGTGLPTPSGITYFTDQTCIRRSFFRCSEYGDKLGYRVNLVMDGDDTVVTASALSMSEDEKVERWWLNLKKVNESELLNRKHRDIFEIHEISNVVLTISEGNSHQNYSYLSTSTPFLSSNRLVFQLHSPLDLSARLSDGVVVSSSSPNERNVMYRRFGELQYLVVPSDESDYTVELVGEAEGSFTLEIEQYRDSEVTKRQSFKAIPSALGTRVSLLVGNPDSVLDDEIKLAVDYDGNGSVDAEYNERGLIESDSESYTYSDLKQLIRSWSLPPARSKVLLVLVEVAEKLGSKASLRPQLKTAERAALRVLESKLRQYRGQVWITESQFGEAESIIMELIK